MGERVSHGGPIFAALPSLLAGTSRQPLPPKGDAGGASLAPLQALSLVGPATRFATSKGPDAFEVEHAVEDSRRIVPDALRRPMLRLLAGKMATEHPAMAIARTLDDRHLRPHPFDLPRLDAFVRRHAERLGTTAQQWAHRKSGEPEATLSYYDREVLDDDSWPSATMARRVTYLSQRRSEAPAAARGLLEGVWANETADARVRLLGVLSVQLHADDRPFLKSVEKDRAPRVRALAARLLARLGSDAEHPALTACLERIKRTESGLLRKKPALALELPATVKEHAATGWIREAFAEVSLEELSRALQLTVPELIDAAGKDAGMLLALAMMATAEAGLGALDAVVRHLPDAWEQMSSSGALTLETYTREERQRWASILIKPQLKNLVWNAQSWSWLHAAIDCPAPCSLLDAAFGSSWFDEPPTAASYAMAWMEITAVLCPAERRGRLRERASRFDPAVTGTALLLLDLLDALETKDGYA